MTYTQHRFRISEQYFQEHPLAALAEIDQCRSLLLRILEEDRRNRKVLYFGKILSTGCNDMVLDLDEETPDGPAISKWHRLLKDFPHIEHYWFAQGDVWRTNDRLGVFFKDRYAVASTKGFDYRQSKQEKRFQSAEDLLKFFSAYFSMEIPTRFALSIIIAKHNEDHPENSICIMEMQISDDPILTKEGKQDDS